MAEVTGDLGDLILDLDYLNHPDIIIRKKDSDDNHWYEVIKEVIRQQFFAVLTEENTVKRIDLMKKFNHFLGERLKRGYEEDGRCYIELFNTEGTSDLYFVRDAEEGKKYYRFTV